MARFQFHEHIVSSKKSFHEPALAKNGDSPKTRQLNQLYEKNYLQN
jgi:hypothetical protein